MFANKRGLVNSLIAVVFALFLFAVASVVAINVWDDVNGAIQSLDEGVADNYTKAQIADLGGYVSWADNLFSFIITVLILGLLITSFTLPAESYWLLVVYFGLLLLVTFIAMFVSNTWTVLVENPSLIGGLGELSFTDFVMRTFPYIVFFVGVLSGLIFYLRARNTTSLGGGFVGGGEEF